MLQYSSTEERVTHENYINDEIKSNIITENVCYHSVQDLLPSRVLSKYLVVKI